MIILADMRQHGPARHADSTSARGAHDMLTIHVPGDAMAAGIEHGIGSA